MWTSGRSIANWRRRATWRPMWCWRRIASIIAAARITPAPKCHADAVTPTIIERIGFMADIINPLGLNGFEFVEFTSPDPEAMGRQFEQLGFVARHRHPTKNNTRHKQGRTNLTPHRAQTTT